VDWGVSAGAFGLVLGFMTGTAAGVPQWVALRRPRRVGSRLVRAMGLAIGVNDALRRAPAPRLPPVRGRPDGPRLARYVGIALAMTARAMGASRSDRSLVAGAPAAPGRATGPVRVIRSSSEFDLLQPGETLGAPLTTSG